MQFLKVRLPAILFFSLIGYAALLLFAVNFGVIQAGLDPSWGFAANLFSHSPFKFGTDLVFTYGPLAYLAIPEHVGSNIAIAAIVHILIWCVFLYLVLDFWQSGRRTGAAIFLIGMILSNRLFYLYWDYFLTAILLLLFLRLLDQPQSREHLLLLMPLTGLCLLVKFTAFIVAMTLLVIYAIWRFVPLAKSNRTEKTMLAATFLSGPVAYLLYNPSLSGLIRFIRGSLQESSGHSAAMSWPATDEIGLRGAALCLALAVCSIGLASRKIVTPVGSAMSLALTWIALKHGYVRADPFHESLFCCFAILVLAFLLSQIHYTRRLALVCIPVAATFVGIALQGASGAWPVWNRFWWTPDANLSQAAKLLNWDSEMSALDAASERILSTTPIDQYADTLGRSRVLIFPWEISYGAHRQFTTVPLFSVQSYLAYTHYLDQESAAHLRQASPPVGYGFFQWQSVDSRNPLADVPATWNVLFSDFEPTSSGNGVLLLKRRRVPLAMKFQPTSQTAFAPETWVPIPESSTPIGLSISLKPTLAGTFLQTFYKLDAVYLEFRTRSGLTSEFRVPPDNLSNPFPINALPVSYDGLSALWSRNEVLDPITAIRLAGPGLGHLDCGGYQFYAVGGTEIHILPGQPKPPVVPETAQPAASPVAGDLTGYLDLVNGVAPPQPTDPAHPASVTPTGTAVVEGWLILGPPPSATTMDEVYGVLNGKLLKAAIVQRADVAGQFHNPDLTNAGFRLEIDPQLFSTGAATRLDITGRTKDGKLYRFPQPLYLLPHK